ncbi:MAG: hypothetical protein IT459_02705 [Planctomycetes bacterium]|nr:hypothetical protein [Planctomycetota bacterium]
MTTFAQIAIAIDSRKSEEGAQSVVAGTEKIVEGAREAAKAVNEADRALNEYGRRAVEVGRRTQDFGRTLGGGAGPIDPLRQRVAAIRRSTAQNALLDRYSASTAMAIDPETGRQSRYLEIDAQVRKAAEGVSMFARVERDAASAAREVGSSVASTFNPFQRMDGVLGLIIKKSPFILGADLVARVAGFNGLMDAGGKIMQTAADGIVQWGKNLVGLTPQVEAFNSALEAQYARMRDIDDAAKSSSVREVQVSYLTGDSFFGGKSFDVTKYTKDLGDIAGTKEAESAISRLMQRVQGLNEQFSEGLYGTDQSKQIDAVTRAMQAFDIEIAAARKAVQSQREETKTWVAEQDRLSESIRRSDASLAQFTERSRVAARDRAINEGLAAAPATQRLLGGLANKYLIDPFQFGAKAEASALAEANRVGKDAFERARQFDEERAALLRVTLAREAYNRELAKSVYGAADRTVSTLLTKPMLAGIEKSQGSQDDVRGMLRDLQFESRLVGMTNDQRERAITLREAEARSAGFQSRAIADYIEEIDAELAKLQEKRRWNELSRNIGDAFGRGLEDGLMDLRHFQDAVESMVMDIERLLLRKNITNPFAEWISGALSGMFGGGGWGGGGSGGGSGSGDLDIGSGGGGSAPAMYGGPGPGVAMAGGRAVVIHQTIQVTTGGGGWTPRDGDGLRRSARQAAEDANAILQRRR